MHGKIVQNFRATFVTYPWTFSIFGVGKFLSFVLFFSVRFSAMCFLYFPFGAPPFGTLFRFSRRRRKLSLCFFSAFPTRPTIFIIHSNGKHLRKIGVLFAKLFNCIFPIFIFPRKCLY